MDKGPARINHLNGKRTVTVAANVQDVDAGKVTAEAMKIANTITFPQGYGLGLGGASRDQAELFGVQARVIAVVLPAPLRDFHCFPHAPPSSALSILRSTPSWYNARCRRAARSCP